MDGPSINHHGRGNQCADRDFLRHRQRRHRRLRDRKPACRQRQRKRRDLDERQHRCHDRLQRHRKQHDGHCHRRRGRFNHPQSDPGQQRPGRGFGNGIEFFAGSSGNWTISKNHFTNNQGADIGIVGGGDTVSNVTITDNDFFASAGIFLITSANTLVEDNAFSDSLGDAIDLAGGNNGVTITQNRITDPVGSGINVIGDVYGLGGSGGGPDLNVSISHNKVTGAGTAGISISQGSVAIDDNTLTGDVVGVLAEAFYEDPGYYSGTIDATLDGNTITGNTAAGIVAGSAQTTAPIYLLAQNNTITGDGEGVVISNGATVDLGTDVTDTVHQDFSGLGTSAGNNILTGYTGVGGNYAIDDQNTVSGGQPNVLAEDDNFGPYPAGDPGAIGQVINDSANNSSLTTVYYLPTLNLPTPAPTTVYVNVSWAGSAFGSDPGALGGGNSYGYDEFSDIQDAINAVAATGTVNIYSGNYDPNLVITRPVTIEWRVRRRSHDCSAFGGSWRQSDRFPRRKQQRHD